MKLLLMVISIDSKKDKLNIFMRLNQNPVKMEFTTKITKDILKPLGLRSILSILLTIKLLFLYYWI